MRGIILKDSVKNFGFKDGFSFWFRWNFIDPFKIFYWKYIIAKPLCTYHGYFMCSSNCQHKKITGRRNIIQYEKERHKKIEEESKTIKGSSDGICVYCGDEKGTEIIDDPNFDTLERWLVCKTCEEVIKIQQELSFLSFSKIDNPERAIELNDRLLEISERTGKPIFNYSFTKKNDGSYFVESITFGKEQDAHEK